MLNRTYRGQFFLVILVKQPFFKVSEMFTFQEIISSCAKKKIYVCVYKHTHTHFLNNALATGFWFMLVKVVGVELNGDMT